MGGGGGRGIAGGRRAKVEKILLHTAMVVFKAEVHLAYSCGDFKTGAASSTHLW